MNIQPAAISADLSRYKHINVVGVGQSSRKWGLAKEVLHRHHEEHELWGLLWGVLVFHELRGGSQTVYAQVTGGSLLMALGAVAIALSSATEREHSSWQDAATREGQRYGIEDEYVRAGMEGREMEGGPSAASPTTRTLLDWLLILGTTSLFVLLAVMARLPHMDIALGWAVALAIAMLALLATCGTALWRTPRFR